MSVTFNVRGIEANWETGEGVFNLSNANAREVLALLGLEDPYLCGTARCRDVVAACDRALASGMKDGVRLGSVSTGPQGCTVVECGRPAGYLAHRISQLRELARQGGDLGTLCWG